MSPEEALRIAQRFVRERDAELITAEAYPTTDGGYAFSVASAEPEADAHFVHVRPGGSACITATPPKTR